MTVAKGPAPMAGSRPAAYKIQEIKIPLPPLPKQKEIAKKVEAIRTEIAKIKSHASEILETTQKEIGAMLKT